VEFLELELDLPQGSLDLVALLEIENGLAVFFADFVIALAKLGEEDRATVYFRVVAGPVREDLRDPQAPGLAVQVVRRTAESPHGEWVSV
jgi:hypothetical protein